MADDQNTDQNTDQGGDAGISEAEGRQLLGVDPNTGRAGANRDDTDSGDPGERSETDTAAKELEKWKAMSRKNEKALRDAQAKLQEFENAKLSESERLQKERDDLKSKAEKAQAELSRMRIAAETAPEGATLAQLNKVAKRMTGDDDAALEADARELWEDFGPGRSAAKPPVSKPKEKLRGGTGDPDDDDDVGFDPAKLAALVPRAR
jgi:hypothetical protein